MERSKRPQAAPSRYCRACAYRQDPAKKHVPGKAAGTCQRTGCRCTEFTGDVLEFSWESLIQTQDRTFLRGMHISPT